MHCRVGEVVPGEGAWQADLRPGDEILEVNGRRVVVFGDLLQAVIGDVQNGMTLVVRRPGEEKLLDFKVQADPSGGRPHIGVLSASMTSFEPERIAALPASPAAEAKPPFQPGDTIVQLDDQPIHSYAELRLPGQSRRQTPAGCGRAEGEAGGRRGEDRREERSPDHRGRPESDEVVRPRDGDGPDFRHPGQLAGRRRWRRAGRNHPHARRQAERRSADPAQAFRALRGRDVVLGIGIPARA